MRVSPTRTVTNAGEVVVCVSRVGTNGARVRVSVSGVETKRVDVRVQTSPSKLADAGLAPRKARRKLTSEENLQRAVNANATREARHTMGSRAKAKIKGKGVVVVVVPPAEPSPSDDPAPGMTNGTAPAAP